MSMVVSLYLVMMSCFTHLRMWRKISSCAFVCSRGMYAVMAMMEVPSCVVIMAALILSVRCVGVCMGVASLLTSRFVAKMVPVDPCCLEESSFEEICVSL